MAYPARPARDNFYALSEVTVEKADNIRLQDISLAYNFDKAIIKSLPFQSVSVYMYLNNVAMIWKANKAGLDPDYETTPRMRISAGLRINL
jgi:hypothetical protein